MINALVEKRVREGRAGEAGDIVKEHQLVELSAGTFTHSDQNILMNSMVIDSMNGAFQYIVSLAFMSSLNWGDRWPPWHHSDHCNFIFTT